jgi:uncharacterized membrane protein
VPVLRYRIFAVALLILLGFSTGVLAADPSYSVTYTIDIHEDGSALWHVEYRTLLVTEDDQTAFDAYSQNLQTVYLPEFQDLMKRSAAQATIATSRPMEVSGFSADAAVQTSPTGNYGVVFYSFIWKGFVRPGAKMNVGDAFVGGLYLEKGNTLVVRYPDSYTVITAEPAPDQVRDGLIWYGQRSFGAGEPRIVLEKQSLPYVGLAFGLGIVILIIVSFGIFLMRDRRKKEGEPEGPALPLSESDIKTLEERIIQLLTSHGGELYQSEITKLTGLPKSTVSAALNALHERGAVQKIKKGRENLIRIPGLDKEKFT